MPFGETPGPRLHPTITDLTSLRILPMKPFRLVSLFALFLLLSAQGAWGISRAGVADGPPNIVVVLIDDMGWGDFSCFGNTDAKTPNVDRVASEGIRFKQFYVNAPICSPSRCALTTGQYPHRWRITSFLNNRNDNGRRGVANWLDPKAPTLAKTLHANGYATGHFGKWHLGGQRDVDEAPTIASYGFDASLTNFEGMGAKLLPLTLKPGDKEPGRIWENAVRLGGPVTWKIRSQITTGYIDAAIPFMEAAVKQEKPFFINLWPDDVHSPFWPSVENWKETKREKYLEVLQEMDQQLGKLFAYLASNPKVRDNTILVICSDNGPEPGAGSAGPFRGTKATLYEGGVRSPLIVWAPGLLSSEKRGTVNEESVFVAMDLVPSLLALSKSSVNLPTQLDGEDLSKTLMGHETASRSKPIFWRRPPDRKVLRNQGGATYPDLACRDGKWKFYCEYDGTGEQLYNLEEDIGEQKNVATDHADVVARIKTPLLAWHAEMPPDRGPEIGTSQE